MKNFILIAFILVTQFAYSQNDVKVFIDVSHPQNVISKHIYGHFSEHLGRCIYDGFWVGEDSDIPNVRGIRTDIVDALKMSGIPNLRWPGGCFADEYHWMDGIGDKKNRPEMINTHWGGVTENNAFGTHEFLDLCDQLSAEPYICGNVGSGSVEEMSKWVEYINFDGKSPMADLRRKNGRDKAWQVSFWGVGNESWGCGGRMTADFYADQYKRYAQYCRNYEGKTLKKIACGPSDFDYNWTETMMKKVPYDLMWGLSWHYYTTSRPKRGFATDFGEDEYIKYMNICWKTEEGLREHIKIMDKYDPKRQVGLVVDEWGSWYYVEPGTNPGFLYQQNTLRDAFIAGISLNLFNKYSTRVRMANIAQTVNVLQSMFLTDGPKMILTPTFYVFDMYKVHQEAELLPTYIESPYYEFGEYKVKAISLSASKDKNGTVHVSIVNVDPHNDYTLDAILSDKKVKNVSGKILTSESLNDHNTFSNPDNIKPVTFTDVKLVGGDIKVIVPSKSIVVLEIK